MSYFSKVTYLNQDIRLQAAISNSGHASFPHNSFVVRRPGSGERYELVPQKSLLDGVVRLFLACVPPLTSQEGDSAPMFSLTNVIAGLLSFASLHLQDDVAEFEDFNLEVLDH